MVIVFPIIPWGFLWQRPQQLCAQFGELGHHVHYIAQIDGLEKILSDQDPQTIPNFYSHLVAPNVFHAWSNCDVPFELLHEGLPEQACKALLVSVSEMLGAIGADRPFYLVQHPAWFPLIKQLVEKVPGYVIYDCMDEHSGFSEVSDKAIAEEEELLSSADLVFATSDALYEKAIGSNDNVLLLRNAADFNHFHRVPDTPVEESFGEGPIIGYYGSIRDWFDVELVEYLAKERTNYQFVLIGADTDKLLGPVQNLPNVHALGERDYEKLQSYLHSFSVCTIPFRINELTRATNPVKFYEYLSAGKPVVSVRLPELEQYKSLCYLADSKEEFLEKLDTAVSETSKPGDQLYEQRIAVAKENTWQARATAALGAMEELRSKDLSKEQLLADEARYIHTAVYKLEAPEEVVTNYVAFQRQIQEPNQTDKIQTSSIINRGLNIEAIEFYLRLTNSQNELTGKFKTLSYLIELRPEHYRRFVGEQSARLKAITRLAWHTIRSCIFFFRGWYLVSRHRLVSE